MAAIKHLLPNTRFFISKLRIYATEEVKMYRGKIQGTEKKVLVGPREARGIFEMIDTKIQVLMKNLNQEGIISQKRDNN